MNEAQLQQQIQMLQAHLFAQGWLLTALVDTHPRRDLLQDEFGVLAERHIAQALGGGSSNESITALESARDRWLEWLKDPGNPRA